MIIIHLKERNIDSKISFPRSASSRILNLLQLTNTGLEITATNDAFRDKNAFLRYFASISTVFFFQKLKKGKKGLTYSIYGVECYHIQSQSEFAVALLYLYPSSAGLSLLALACSQQSQQQRPNVRSACAVVCSAWSHVLYWPHRFGVKGTLDSDWPRTLFPLFCDVDDGSISI